MCPVPLNASIVTKTTINSNYYETLMAVQQLQLLIYNFM